jgi:hypothetical protein
MKPDKPEPNNCPNLSPAEGLYKSLPVRECGTFLSAYYSVKLYKEPN